MRVLETGDFLPEGIDLLLAVLLDLVDGLALEDTFAADEDGFEELTGREVLEGLLLPGVVRVKEQVGFALVDDFVGQGEDVGLRLAGLLVVETPDFLDTGQTSLTPGVVILVTFSEILIFGMIFPSSSMAQSL